MAQFDVHRYRGTVSGVRYVVDIQSNLLQELSTRLVAPAYPLDAHAKPMSRLNPIVSIAGTQHYLAIQEMSAIRTASLGAKEASLQEQREAIVAAVDLLVTGI